MNAIYTHLAAKLDSLPNGFPATPDGAEIRLLQKLFTPDEASLAVRLTREPQTAVEIAERLDPPADPPVLGKALKGMVRKGLIDSERTSSGIGFKLLPFVVGIYEMQIGTIDAELAGLFEAYYTQAFGQLLQIQPAVHRVIPVQESIKVGIEVRSYESAVEIIDQAQAWGVLDCICRTQKVLIGQACEHPIDVCMALAPLPGMFDHSPVIHPLTREQAHATLHRAASAGLVHSVSNSQEGLWYICNCCTCSCGILRGIAEMGIADAVARSPFVNTIDLDLCIACEACLEYCQFQALKLDNGRTQVSETRCVGCGICVPACPENALRLVRRESSAAPYVPKDFAEWSAIRLSARTDHPAG